jgi:hypothetical protein
MLGLINVSKDCCRYSGTFLVVQVGLNGTTFDFMDTRLHSAVSALDINLISNKYYISLDKVV